MKKVLAISSVLLSVVFLAGCGQQSTQPVTTQPVQQNNKIATTIPSGWKTYKSNFFNLTVSVPGDWKEVAVGDGNLVAISEATFEGYAPISSPDGKESLVFTVGPINKTNNTCQETPLEIDGQKVNKIVCNDASEKTIPGHYNYEFVGKKLIVVLNAETTTTDKIISLIKFN